MFDQILTSDFAYWLFNTRAGKEVSFWILLLLVEAITGAVIFGVYYMARFVSHI